jgi:outer membrane protein
MSVLKVLKAPSVTKLKLPISMLGALVLVLCAGTAMAQTPPATTQKPTQAPGPTPTPPAPGTQKPPAPATPGAPAAQTPPASVPPKPFPEGAKIAYVNVQAIASNSVEGKAATAKLDELRKKKAGELAEKNKALQAAQTKLQQGGSVLNDQARGQLDKEIEKLNRDIQFFQQDANTELQDLQNQLQAEFQEKLNPVLEQVAAEKGLHMLIDIANSGAVWANSGLDLSAEVIRRFDAALKTPVKK